MTQATDQTITRRSIALAGIGAAVGAVVPAGATPGASSLLPLWQEHERLRQVLDLAHASPSHDDAADAACTAAIAALWDFDDRIMAAPVASVADLAVKARVIKDHVDISDDFITAIQDYAMQLLADIAALAKMRA